MKFKTLTTVALITALGLITPTVFLASPSFSQGYTGIRVQTDKLLKIRVTNEAGKPILYGLSQTEPKTLPSGRSGVMPFSQIKTVKGEVNVLIYTLDGANLTFKSTYNASENELNITVTSGGAGHKSVSIGPDGIVELI